MPILVVAATSMAALTACGTVHATVTYTGTAPSPPQQQRAQTDAEASLASFTAPPGARRIAAVPATAADALGKAPVVAGQIDDVAYWEVSGSPTTLLAWVRAHLPHRYTLRTSGTEGGTTLHPYVATTAHPPTYPASGRAWYDEFSLPASGSLQARMLVVSAAYASASQVVIRVDGQDGWAMTRTAADRVGGTITGVVVSRVREFGPIAASDKQMVTDASIVARVVKLVNGLPMYASGTATVTSCPTELAPVLRLWFLNGSTTVATATVNATACDTVSLTIEARPSALLGNGTTFANEVEALATLNGVNPGGPMVPAG